MKDIIKVGVFIAIEEPSGKTGKVLATTIKNIAKKYEPQITKIVNALTEEIISKEVKDGEQKNEK